MTSEKVEIDPWIAAATEWLELCGDFRAFQQLLRERELPSGVGWDPIAKSLSAHERRDDVLEVIHEHVDEVVRYGTKSIFLAEVPEGVRKALRSYAARHQERPDEWDLSPGGSNGIVAIESGRRTAATFIARARRRLTKREAVDKDWIKADRLKELGVDVELYAVATRSIPVFDVVRVPADGPITFHITSSFNGYRMPLKAEVIADELSRALASEAEVDFSPRYLDLFHLVEGIYGDGDEGRVAGMRFNCGTGAKRHEEHPTKDLRQEIYHATGAKLTTVELYALTAAWLSGTGEVAVSLNGTSRMLEMMPGTRLLRAESTAWSERDHNFVIAKLRALVTQHAPNDEDGDGDESDR